MKILAIDDNNDNLISLRAVLIDAFPDSILYTALNGPDGIELAARNDPDVVLLDIIMPIMDGFEVCRRLKIDPKLSDIPVVFLTALKETKENRIKALSVGAEAFLPKPIDEMELIVQIRAMVKIKYVNRHNRDEKEHLARLVSERTQELEKSQSEMIQVLEDLKAENEGRRITEKALIESERCLQELNATKDKMFSIIAHDLKSPFNSILGFSNLLVEQVRQEDYQDIEEYAGIIQESSKRVMTLLSNLLDWARSQTGRMDFNPEEIKLSVLINEAVELSKDVALQKSISISKEIPDTITVFVDQTMISTVLRNIISNAIKFTHPKGTISISVENKPDEVMVSICDNGIGMSKDVLENVFLLNQCFSTNGTQNEQGTGLGLVICKEFIQKHRGKIWVESKPEKGSHFHFTIPNTSTFKSE